MALTRPKIWDIDTNIEWFVDPITVLHQSSTLANVDVGFLFNRANGLVSNVALYWNESTQNFVAAYTSSDGTTNSNITVTSYANVTVGNLSTTGSNGNISGVNTIFATAGSYSGNITSGNVLATGFFYANGAPFVSSNFNPASPGTIGGTTPGAATFSSLKTTQTTVTVGANAGSIGQGTYAVGIGTYAGYNTQGAYSVVIGGQAGQNTAGTQSILIGYNAGFNSNNANVVAIGSYAGTQYQGQGAVAVGSNAGSNYQANNAIAIGNSAGVVQSAPSIILNTSGNTLNDGGRAGFIVSAVRNDTGNVTNAVYFNTTTSELTYGPASGGGSVTAGNINPALYLGRVTATTAPTLIDTLPLAGNTRVSWYTTSYDSVNAQYRVSTIDSLNNGSTVYFNEYGVILSNVGTTVATFTSNITGSNINLYATGNSASVTVTFERLVLGSATSAGYFNVGPAGPAGTINSTTSNIVTTSANAATSTTTGALQVAGGAGIAGNVYIGGNIYVTSNVTTGTTTRVEYNIPHPFMLMGAA